MYCAVLWSGSAALWLLFFLSTCPRATDVNELLGNTQAINFNCGLSPQK